MGAGSRASGEVRQQDQSVCHAMLKLPLVYTTNLSGCWAVSDSAGNCVCRHSALKKMRGRLLPNSFTAAHYGLLADIGLSQEEKQNELATVQIAVEAAKDKATAVESGHVYECSVELCHGTFASILVLHNSQLKHTQQAMYSQLHKAE